MAKCYKTKKDCFPTRFECDIARAEIAKNSVKHRKQRFRELPVRSYQCEFCHQWHHTSQSRDQENESQLVPR
jgi:hypothetical protein